MQIKPLALILLDILVQVNGRRITHYIDDEFGDSVTGEKPVYFGNGWVQGSTCSDCPLKPDPSQAWNNTWHYNSRSGNDPAIGVNLTFTGVSVIAWIIVPNTVPGSSGAPGYGVYAYMDDDAEPDGGYFQPAPESTNDFTYKFQMYTNNTLANTTHTLRLVSEPRGNTDSVFLFDYAQYVFDDGLQDDTPTTSSPESNPTTSTSGVTPSPSEISDRSSGSNPAIVAGAVVGTLGLVAVAIIISLFILRRRRRRRQLQSPDSTADPYLLQVLPPDVKRSRGSSRGRTETGSNSSDAFENSTYTYDTTSVSNTVPLPVQEEDMPPPAYQSISRWASTVGAARLNERSHKP
ncbi:hypothetical protein VNI00_007888 [Paramarasmius palmivorus]|uniref:Uncharacterized protein n=1 Tax=Paramarasmius palmivorus TaxID=297713 RepID=A0AAW0CZ12_9AGAR